MEILKTVDLKKYYGSGENQVKALDGVNLSVEEGEFVSVVGTSGSGNQPFFTCWADWTMLLQEVYLYQEKKFLS